MEPHSLARSLFTHSYYSLGNGSVVIPEDECFCKAWLGSRGSDYENRVANVSQWIAFGVSVALLIFYAYEALCATCGWEEVYVCSVELSKVVLEFFHEFDNPAMLYLGVGTRVQWLRYAEWLLTCPVILIHLSNLTGMKEDYSFRTMRLLVSDVGTIVFGATAAICTGYIKLIFFLIGCVYGCFTFYTASKVYIEAHAAVPKGKCQWLVKLNAVIFFGSWTMYPVLFALGPEGFGVISILGSTTAHTYLDLMSKNAWGLVGHALRVAVWRHVVIHGEESVGTVRQSMSVSRLEAAKAAHRLSIGSQVGPTGHRLSIGSQVGHMGPRTSIGSQIAVAPCAQRTSLSSQSGMAAVPPVSTSGITWTSSDDRVPSGEEKRRTSTCSPSSSSGQPTPSAAARSHFWSTSGKSSAAVAPAPAADAGSQQPAVVSVRSRAGTANGMAGKDGTTGSGSNKESGGFAGNDVIAASDIVAKVDGNGPASGPVSALTPPPPAQQQAAVPTGGWQSAGSPGDNAAQQRRLSLSSREQRGSATGSRRLPFGPAAPMESVTDVDEEGEDAVPPLPAAALAAPQPAGRRSSSERINSLPGGDRRGSSEGVGAGGGRAGDRRGSGEGSALSRPATSSQQQQSAALRGHPALTAADI